MNAQATTYRAPGYARAPAGNAGIVFGMLLVATLFGLIGGYLGFQIQLLLTLAIVALLAVAGSQTLALFVFITVMAFHPTPYFPRVIQNLAIFGIPLLFIARMLLRTLVSRDAQVPLPKELVLYIAVMFLGVSIGYTHLHEIPSFVVIWQANQSYGFKEYVLGFFAKQMTLVAMAVIIGSLVIDRRRGQWIVTIMLGSAVLYVVAMVYLLLSGGVGLNQLGTTRRLFATLGRHSNQIGYMLVTALAIALFFREGLRAGFRRLLATMAVALLVAGVLMSASRGAVLGMLVVFTVYCLTYRRAGSFFTAVFILLAAFALAPQSVQERLVKGIEPKRSVFSVSIKPSDELSSGRFDIWRQVAPEVLDNPVFGNGLRATMWSKYNRHGGGFKVLHPHNLYLSSLMDIGLVGTFIVGLMYLYFLRHARRLAADARVGAAMQNFFRAGPAIGLAILTLGIANGHAYPAPEQLYVWVFFGVTLGYARLYPAALKSAAAQRRGTTEPAGATPPATTTAATTTVAAVTARGTWRR